MRANLSRIFSLPGKTLSDIDSPILVSRSRYFVISDRSLHTWMLVAEFTSQQFSQGPSTVRTFGCQLSISGVPVASLFVSVFSAGVFAFLRFRFDLLACI